MRTLRAMKAAAWLGWQAEANWTHPLLYALITVLQGAGLLLILSLLAIAGGHSGPGTDFFACLFVGSAVFLLVTAGVQGIARTVIDDRERFRTLRAIYASPVWFPAYLAGRGAGRVSLALVGTVSLLCMGAAFLSVPLQPAHFHGPLLGFCLVVGLVGVATLGFLLAALSMVLTRHAQQLVDGAGGTLYLFSGAVFPIDLLPAPLRHTAEFLPVGPWIELTRRALLGRSWSQGQALGAVSTQALVLRATCASILLLAVAFAALAWADRTARRRGLLDRTTGA